MNFFYQRHLLLSKYRTLCLRLVVFSCLVTCSFGATAQCPTNIDFELGNFTGWQCYIGNVASGTGILTLNPSPPVAGRHTMLSSAFPGDGADYWGDFPKNCPNGSGHSIQLGNQQTGAGAERVSYTFTIPANQNTFSLIYNYAMVLQDFGHTPVQQPRLTITVTNLTDQTTDPCSSFDFVVNGTLPGFFVSPHSPANAPVRCKPWAAASINLDGNAGKTIELSFTTTDCSQGGHFGYAYIDVNTECGSSFVGSAFCPDDSAIDVIAPFGYEKYVWYDVNFTQILGNLQTLHISPPPVSGTQVAVVVTPYNGYGCKDTLIANLLDTLNIVANAGRDTTICTGSPVQLGVQPRLGLVYKWTPVTGLSNPDISNPIATIFTSTTYVLTVTNSGGGCLSVDTVNVNSAILSDSLQLIGSANYCTATGLSALLKVFPADSIQWYRNGTAIPGATQTTYLVTQTGAYKAEIISFAGCSLFTRTQQIDIYESPVAGFVVNNTGQCYSNNQFVFTNTSTIAAGSLQYNWDLGDGTTATTQHVTHSYLQPGVYTVRMLASAAGGCADSSSVIVTVFPGPVAGFTTNTANQCLKGNNFIFTNTSTIIAGNLLYKWYMGDGTQFSTKDVNYSYATPGTYTVKMVVQTVAGTCKDSSSFDVTVYPSPVAGFVINAVNQCFPNHQFVFTNTSTVFSGTLQYRWELGDGSTANTRDVTYSYVQPGTYTVKLLVTAASDGCADSSSFTVTVYPYATADFRVNPVCMNLRLPLFNQTKDVPGTTVNYLWDFGNGQTSSSRIPVYSYAVPGTYTVKLSVSTAQCPLAFNSMQALVYIEAQQPGISYPIKNTISFYRDSLKARNIGNSVLWVPAISLDNRLSYTPVFYGPADQLYIIQLRTPAGCVTVDTQFVKTGKNIKIYVPNIFTPNGDTKNDFLRPWLMSIERVNYFKIYNRWGKLIFQMAGDRPGWDGRINGQPAEPQTVVWMIEAVDVDGVVHRQQGTTVLMR